MEFYYKHPEKIEATICPSQAIMEALGKKALKINTVEALLGPPELIEIKEKIESQAEASLIAASTLINRLNYHRDPKDKLQFPTSEEFQGILDAKMEQLTRDNSLEWCANYIKQNGGDMILVATPNTLVNSFQEMSTMVKRFVLSRKDLARDYTYEKMYELYSAEELSGPVDSDSKIRLSLIPTSHDPKMLGTTEYQRGALKNLQITNPNIKVPSVLDALAYWQMLSHQGLGLDGNLTPIRHFDLPEKRGDEAGYTVPDAKYIMDSYVCYNGAFLNLGYSDSISSITRVKI